jgi:hypothetical protein
MKAAVIMIRVMRRMSSQRIKRKDSLLSKIVNMSISIIPYKTIILSSLQNDQNPFDEIEKVVFLFPFDNPKQKGDFWELFSRDWLANHPRFQYDNVYLLNDIPSSLQLDLNLRKRGQKIQDTGIDLVAKKGDKYHAVQCKYKREKETLTWKELSTFFSLCSCSGPWENIIIMTNNCGSFSNKVSPPPNTLIYFRTIFRITTKAHWMKIIGAHEYKLRFVEIKNENKEEKGETKDESLLSGSGEGVKISHEKKDDRDNILL